MHTNVAPQQASNCSSQGTLGGLNPVHMVGNVLDTHDWEAWSSWTSRHVRSFTHIFRMRLVQFLRSHNLYSNHGASRRQSWCHVRERMGGKWISAQKLIGTAFDQLNWTFASCWSFQLWDKDEKLWLGSRFNSPNFVESTCSFSWWPVSEFGRQFSNRQLKRCVCEVVGWITIILTSHMWILDFHENA